ncbi:N-acetyl-gamma-glutamyl-phosphate reductase [Thiohalorhabdus methylotrophus]|uniref:N-acetyl-gamma-glutamyl-phosphate reductase n=1 Tax=Thiohalorhabdus methylotrophus TaxID=3242694 RepID=A0ABV4TQN6_9GAMM
METTLRVGILGGSGYTGVELLRILAGHPRAEVTVVTSRQAAGQPVADMFPSLRGWVDLEFEEPDTDRLAEGCDLVFCGVPHGVAMHQVPALLDRGVRVVDLSADFRIADRAVYEEWYKETHAAPAWLERAVYGLPEVNTPAIRDAALVANPGCYPTAVQLAFLPLLEAGVISREGMIADAKSGASGGGREAKTHLLLAEASDSMSAYGVAGHRHLPEIEQGLSRAAGESVALTFVPHLAPMIRGIHADCYALLDGEAGAGLQDLFEARFGGSPFVDVMPEGSHPGTRSVRGSNFCRLAVHRPRGGRQVVVLSVIDNLVKGAAGQAVQNMNLMFGLPEEAGLDTPPMQP